MAAISADFDQLMQDAKLPDDIVTALRDDNFDVQSFAMLALSLDTLDAALDECTLPPLTARTRASLRVLWRSCNSSIDAPIAATSAAPDATSSSQNSWNDFFPPKLQPDVVRKLLADFGSSYPSEVLQPETLPSPRLLSLCHSQLNRREWRWIPWKFRLSQKMHDDQSMSRPRKILRSESFQDMLFDDVPTRDIPQHQIGLAHLQQLLSLQDFGIALCKGAHLGTLKMYSHKFCQLAGARFEADSGLRPPNCSELAQADQTLWQRIGELYHKGWTLDDSIHEICQIRSDMEALLQPRAAAPKSIASSPKGSGKPTAPPKGAPKGRGGKGKSKGKQQQWITEMTKDGRRVTLCLRYNMGQCSDPQCRFTHACCVSKNGAACGAPHPASKHSDSA